jgi:hypothetical protein
MLSKWIRTQIQKNLRQSELAGTSVHSQHLELAFRKDPMTILCNLKLTHVLDELGCCFFVALPFSNYELLYASLVNLNAQD